MSKQAFFMTGAVPAKVDARGLRCPFPQLCLIRAMETGSTPSVDLVCDDPFSPQGIAAACQERRYHLLESSEEKGVFRFRILRNAPSTDESPPQNSA